MQCMVNALRKTWMRTAVATCLALAAATSQAQDDPPPQAGRLSSTSGTVSIQPAGTDDWGQAFPNYPIGPGDRIFTDNDGRAEIQVGQTYVRIGPNSDVSLIGVDSNEITFGIAQGAMHVRTRGLWDNQALYIQTPSGSSTVQGPADFRVDVFSDQPAALFTTYNGDQYLSGAGDFGMDNPAGQALELVGTNPVYPQWLQPADYDTLDYWSQQRDDQIARAASFRYVSPEIEGADELDASGDWTPGTEYGNVWFPRVDVGWTPYHNGHWVNHDPWGYVWVEDESWGYAPFHFGRWINYHGRWGWVPGPPQAHPVWSPALVVFAGGIQVGGGGVSAWFPLGPGEPYRPWYPCSPRYIDRVNISNITESRVVHVQTTYVNIVNVTNVTNITYVNRTVGVTAMRRSDFAAGRPVAQAAVRVDPQQMAHAQVIARPQEVIARQAAVGRPPARPVRVQAARPVLINAKGMSVAAAPQARPVPPPVRAAPTPRALPGHAFAAPPPNVKMTAAAQKAVQTHPPAAAPPARPVVTNHAVPAQRPVPVQPQRPAPMPAPVTRPEAQPVPRETPRPAQPEAAPHPMKPAEPPARPAPIPETKPAPRPEAQPAPHPATHPQVEPAPRPTAKPATPPPGRPAPRETKPSTEPAAKPAVKPGPHPEDKNKKPEKREETRPPA